MIFDSATFHSISPQLLLDTHDKQERYIEEYAISGATEALKKKEYREKKSALIKEARKNGEPVSISVDIARGDSADARYEYDLATINKNKTKMLVEACREKLFTIRHLNNSIEGVIKTS